MPIDNQTTQAIVKLLKNCQFKELCDTYFGNEFMWIIKGTSILSGIYSDQDVFFEKVINRLKDAVLPGWKMHILDAYVAGNVFIVEMRGEVKTKRGRNYNNEYCWIFKFDGKKIASVTAYYDSLLVNQTLQG
ncbi:MAG: hypothetical protein KAT71_05360 [Gammaproteobacteria bacterium]|nr:hypothetical protein [Gammaproteobacteria bacterium]